MSKPFKIIAILVSALMIQHTNAECSKDDIIKKNIVETMYKAFPYKNNTTDDKSIKNQNSSVLNSYFDGSLTSLLLKDQECSKSGEICDLDFDPIYGSQDPQVDKLSFECSNSDIDVLVFYSRTVKDKKFKPLKLKYKFKLINSNWLIDDILYSNSSSLQKILK